MLEVRDIHAGYGKLKILNGMSLKVEKNSLTAILGGNGCGKSTTLKVITGILKASAGDVLFEGESILSVKPQDIVKKGIAYVTQGKDVFPSLTVEENLHLGAYTLKDKKKIQENVDYVLEKMPRLKDRFKNPSGLLSGGEQQMLSIGRGLMSNPKLLILDEPSAALSPKVANEIYDLIGEIHRQNITLLLVEQNVKKALEISEYAYILSEGHVIFEEKTEVLRKMPDIKSFYLGGNYAEVKLTESGAPTVSE